MSEPTDCARYENLEVAATRLDSSVAPLLLEVTAPSNLPEGYELQVCTASGGVVTVVVPSGGVAKGETFVASIDSSGSFHADNGNVPNGAWRDGLFSCCAHGICHPLFWMALCCSPVVLAQILYRLNLDWTGRPTNRDKADVNFMIVVAIFALYIVIRYIMAFSSSSNGARQETSSGSGYTQIIDLAFVVYIVFVVARARRFIRNKSAIPAQCCGECEDCCCAYWCGCCTVSQMARHTADYDRYAAEACSKTGMAANAPEFV